MSSRMSQWIEHFLNRSRLIEPTLWLVLGSAMIGLLWLPDHHPLHPLATGLLISLAALLLVMLFCTVRQQRETRRQLHEMNARKNRIKALNTRFDNLMNAATQVAVISTTAEGRIRLFSAGAEALFGFNRAEMLGRNLVQRLYLPSDLDERRKATQDPALLHTSNVQLIDHLCRSSGEQATQWSYQRKDGSLFIGELRRAEFHDPDSGGLEQLNVIIDVSERNELLKDIQESKAFLKKLTQRIPNVLYQYHLRASGDGYFAFCSPSIEQLFELKAEDVLGLSFLHNPLFKRVHPEDMPLIISVTLESSRSGEAWACDFRVQLPRQGLRWLHGEAYAERQEDRSVVWYGSFMDITELKDREHALSTQAVTDELTGIYNRRHFMGQLECLVDSGKRYGTGFSLILLDLDHFKSVNDRWGHDMGDEVLKQTCQLIGQRLRTSDIFCRIGGEELAILCPQTSGEQAEQLAWQLRENLARQSLPVVGPVTASFGVAAWDPELSAENLLRLSDQATYAAKLAGRNRVLRA